MSHELEIVNGRANFAYRAEGGRPWHGLGTPIAGYGTAEQMLQEVNGDYEVFLTPVYVQTPDGEFVEVENRQATARINPATGQLQPFEIFRGRYRTEQNAELVDKALAIVGASSGDAVIETMGVLKEGAQFFVAIDLGTLFIDPLGANDQIARYLLSFTSHDGSSGIVHANTEIRAVCANTVSFGIENAARVFKVRHTPNKEARIAEAQQLLGFSIQWGAEFERMANEMLTVDIPVNSGRIDTVLDVLWPEKDADTDRKKDNRNAIVANIRNRYPSDRNAGAVGFNGWGFYNAIAEYLDWGRGNDAAKLAAASIDPVSIVSQRKTKAASAILSLV